MKKQIVITISDEPDKITKSLMNAQTYIDNIGVLSFTPKKEDANISELIDIMDDFVMGEMTRFYNEPNPRIKIKST